MFQARLESYGALLLTFSPPRASIVISGAPCPSLHRGFSVMKHLDPRKRLLGLSFIFAVAVIWVAASFVVQGIQGAGVDAAVLSFIANSLFAVYLPIYWANLRLRQRPATPPDQERAALVPAGSAPSSSGAIEEPLAGSAAARGGDAPQMTWRQLLRVAFVVRGDRWLVVQQPAGSNGGGGGQE